MSTLLAQFLGLDPLGDVGYTSGPVIIREPGADDGGGLKVATVWRAVNVLAAAVATLPLKMYRRLPSGGKEEVRDHWAAQLVYHMPNRAQTSFRWRHHAMGHAVLGGNYYALKMPGANQGFAALWPLAPERMRLVEVRGDGSLGYSYTTAAGQPKEYSSDQVFHFRGFSLDGLVGVSVVDLMRLQLQQAMASQRQRTSFLKNEMRPSVTITHPGDLGPNGRVKLERAFRSAYGGPEHAGTPLVLDEGMTMAPFAFSAKDSQYVESDQFRVEEFLRYIGVPGVLCGYADKTATFASAEAFFQSFKDHNLGPWTKNLETELTIALLGVQDELFFEFSLDAFLRGDSTARAAFYRVMVELGILTRNEVRALENRNPLLGLDEPLTPKNMSSGADQTPEPAPAAPPRRAPEDPAPDDSADAQRVARLERIARESAAAIVRREVLAFAGDATRKGAAARYASDLAGWRAYVVEFYAEHAALLTARLGIPEALAVRYCDRQAGELLRLGVAAVEAWEASRVPELLELVAA